MSGSKNILRSPMIFPLLCFLSFKCAEETLSTNAVTWNGRSMFHSYKYCDQHLAGEQYTRTMQCAESNFSIDGSNNPPNETLLPQYTRRYYHQYRGRKERTLFYSKETCVNNNHSEFQGTISSNVFFKITPELKDFFFENSRLVFVYYEAIKSSVQIYQTNFSYPAMNLANLSILDEKGHKFKYLRVPINLYFKKHESNDSRLMVKVEIDVIPSGYKNFDRDKFVFVYKLEPFPLPGSGLVEVEYCDCCMYDSWFKILVLENVRPDWEIMYEQAKLISVESPYYITILLNQTLESKNFLAIIAENRNPVKKECFGFNVRYRQCYSDFNAGWTTDGCTVGQDTNETFLHCQCWHLSLFGGGSAISPKEIDLQNDLMLFSDIHDSMVAILVGSMILLYLTVIVWTRHADRKDELQRFVVLLDDNFPGEEWPYLITVFTGVWIGASTDSNVSIRLYGSKGMSRVHNLMSNHQRQVLKGNCDDWFLIFTLKNLGTIEKIHVFTDFTNDSPDWYCKKIMVYDLDGQKDYKFVIERWISLDEDEDYCDFYCTPTMTTRKLRRDQIAVDNIIFGLRETHLLLSIFTRHPRSSVTRSQRLSVLICLLLLNMLTNIMFYGIEPTDNPEYSDAKTKLVIQIESTLLSSPIVFMIIFCFKKSRIVTSSRKNVPMTLTSTAAVTLESGLEVNQGSRAMTSASMKSLLKDSESGTKLDPSKSQEEDKDALEVIEEELEEEYEEEEEEEEEEVEEEEETDEEKEKRKCLSRLFQAIKRFITQVIVVKTIMPVKIAEENVESFEIRKKWMIFAWLLCVFTICSCTFFVIFYSLKMNHKVTQEWLSESSALSAKNILIMSPMKIIVFSITLALLYGQLHYIASFDCNTVAAMKKKLMGNERFLAKVLEIRKHKWYRPLTNRATMILRAKTKNWRRWRIILNSLVVFLLYLILTAEVEMSWGWQYCYTSKHFMDMFDPKISVISITTLKAYIEYLENVVIPFSNTKVWYNQSPSVDTRLWNKDISIMKDYVSKVVGVPRLRQLRVKPDACIVPEIMIRNGFEGGCSAPLTLFSMDEQEYSLQWTQVEKATTVFWKYEISNSSPYIVCSSKSLECYSNGGYILNLDFNSEKSKVLIDDMFSKEWFDTLTKVLIYEFVSYNVNINFICYTVIIVERLPGGLHYLSVGTTMFRSTSSSFFLQLTVLLCFALYYFLRIILLFNRKGLEYLFSYTGLMDIFLNILLCCTLISIVLMGIVRKQYLNDWHLNDQADLQIPSDLMFHRAIVRYETAVLVLILPAHLLHSLRFGKRYKVCFIIWNKCIKYSCGLGLIALMFHTGFHLIDEIHEKESWHCLFDRFYGSISYYNTIQSSIDSWALAIPFHFIINTTSFLACITIIYSYKETKIASVYTDDFNSFVFLVGKFNLAVRKMKNHYVRLRNIFKNLKKTKRFRGGAEGYSQDLEEIVPNRSVYYMKQICKDLDDKLDMLLEKVTALERTL